MSEYVGKSWWPEDIRTAFNAATDSLRCTRHFIGEVKATREGDDESYIDHFKNLLGSVQTGLKAIGAIQDELRQAHREIGEPLPTVNGVGGGFAHGLIVDIGCGALNAYSVRSDEGYSHTFYVTPGAMPLEEVRRMRERFQSLEAPSFSLLALAGREAEQAARIRDRVSRLDTESIAARGYEGGKATTDDRLTLLYKNVPESRGWKAPQCAEAIEATAEAVRKCKVWTLNKALQKEERGRYSKRET